MGGKELAKLSAVIGKQLTHITKASPKSLMFYIPQFWQQIDRASQILIGSIYRNNKFRLQIFWLPVVSYTRINSQFGTPVPVSTNFNPL
jgi:hypothetical protein